MVKSFWASFEGTRRKKFGFLINFPRGELTSTSFGVCNFFSKFGLEIRFLQAFGIYQNLNPTLGVPWAKNKKSDTCKQMFFVSEKSYGHFSIN